MCEIWPIEGDRGCVNDSGQWKDSQNCFGHYFLVKTVTFHSQYIWQQVPQRPATRDHTTMQAYHNSWFGGKIKIVSQDLLAFHSESRHNQRKLSSITIFGPQLFFLQKDRSSVEYKIVVHFEDGVSPVLPCSVYAHLPCPWLWISPSGLRMVTLKDSASQRWENLKEDIM